MDQLSVLGAGKLALVLYCFFHHVCFQRSRRLSCREGISCQTSEPWSYARIPLPCGVWPSFFEARRGGKTMKPPEMTRISSSPSPVPSHRMSPFLGGEETAAARWRALLVIVFCLVCFPADWQQQLVAQAKCHKHNDGMSPCSSNNVFRKSGGVSLSAPCQVMRAALFANTSATGFWLCFRNYSGCGQRR